MKHHLSFVKGGPTENDGFITGEDHYTLVSIWAEYEGEEFFEPVSVGSFVKEHHERPIEIVRGYVEIAKSDEPSLTNFTTVEHHIPITKLKELMRDVPRFGGKL